MWPISIKLKDMEIANIQLGYVGENDVTPVIIDCESVFSEYPNAVPTMTVQPPKGLKYPAEIERDGNNVIWTVQDYDLNYDGEGEIQIKFTENGKIKKSASCKTTIKKSIDPEAEAPTPIQDWMERAENVLESLDGLTVSAETLETGEDATAEVSEDEQGHKHIDFGLPRGPQGPGPSSEEITEAVDTYLESNFTNPSNPPLDRSLSSSSSAAPADMVGNLKSAINNNAELYASGSVLILPTYLNKASSGGKPTSDNNTRLISEQIPVPFGATIGITKNTNGTSVVLYLFDNSDTLLKTIYGAYGKEVFAENCDHIRVYVQYNNNDPITPANGLTIATVKFYYTSEVEGRVDAIEENYIKKVVGKNLIDISTSTDGYFISNANGDLSNDPNTYDTTDFIEVKQQSIVFSTKIRKLLEYDSSKAPITATYVTNEQTAGYYFTPNSSAKFIRVSYYHSDRASVMAEYGTTPTTYQPFKYEVESGIHLSPTMLGDIPAFENRDDVLYGKKWVACGDSFTHGDFEYSTEDNEIESGMYAGELKVYPFLIGNRTRMVVVNEAINGSTLTHIEGRSNAFSDTRYQNIAADADYITIKLGINDDASHQNVPIGTIDDATNATFYGAWNVVLSYLITHHLDAKIGIIITNGATLDIANATIAAAEKWGIPYLNEATGKQCSFVFRSNRTDIPSSIRNAKNDNWYVSTTSGAVNHHPNAKAHEFESTVIEAWLRTL